MSGGGVRVQGERYLFTASVVGADAILRKPFEKRELLAAVRRLI